MEGRRWRRTRRMYTPLPVQRARQELAHIVSCWYCEFRITKFNDSIYAFGRQYSRFFQNWFTIGVGFGVLSLIGVTLVLLWDTASSTYYNRSNAAHYPISLNWLFGLELYSSLHLSLMDVGVVLFSALAAIFVHELGHVLAAASLGIEVEYVALFLAVLFPGAFVAFNYDLLKSAPSLSALRVYCAGVWHNAVFCVVCLLAMLSLPSLLHPVYEHIEGLVVLNISPVSPLSGYLTQNDIVVALNGALVHGHKDWRDKLAETDRKRHGESYPTLIPQRNQIYIGGKGYCVPNPWLEESTRSEELRNILRCPDELAAFVDPPLSVSSILIEDGDRSNANGSKTMKKYCLAAQNVVKLSKCGVDWETTGTNASLSCSEDESCLTPVQTPETAWVEISFVRPHSPGCLISKGDQLLVDGNSSDSRSGECGGTFVFVGQPLSLVDSLTVSQYMPRFESRKLGLYLPFFLEKLLYCTFRFSQSLAAFNSLPVFFLDGESILETCFLSMTWFRTRVRRRVFKLFLYSGSLLLLFMFARLAITLVAKPG